MNLLSLPQFERFRGRDDVKVVRHKDVHKDPWKLWREGKFNHYQNGQNCDVFGDARYLVSFIAEGKKFAKFLGVWEILSKRKKKAGGFQYSSKEIPGFEELRERLIARWAEGARAWAQWLHRRRDKQIVEILPPNFVDFPGYYDFLLSYAELATIINNPESNREWYRMLSSVSGVYLILDSKSGKQYVGSAYGKGGIWARWKTYLKSPSGGNARLKKLLDTSPERYKSFQYSILRVLEPESTKGQVIAQEVRAKEKLGARAFGLN